MHLESQRLAFAAYFHQLSAYDQYHLRSGGRNLSCS